MVAPKIRRTFQFCMAVTLIAIGSAASIGARKAPLDYVTGLKLWRQPGAIENGAACATCHSPDGIELAAYNFSDEDIFRRARPHLGDEKAARIVDYIHAVRAKFGLKTLRDPMSDRPGQPGGEVLPGDTPEARDIEFGKELQTDFPLLFKGPIATIEQAREAAAELRSTNPAKLKVGIPLNRLSEDVAHGEIHASIAQWLPEVPPTVPADQLAKWYEAEDNYLAVPNSARLRDLMDLHQTLMGPARQPGMAVLSQAKFRALLVLQHRLRAPELSPPASVAPEIGRVRMKSAPNPIWEVGEIARNLYQQDANGLGFSPEMTSKKSTGEKLKQQMADLQVSWFWLGWLMDQGLSITSYNANVRLGLWLTQSLWDDGPYPIHAMYAETMRQLVISNDPLAWAQSASSRRLFWDYPSMRSGRRLLDGAPKDQVQRDLYRTFAANCVRMNLLLLEADLKQKHTVWVKLNSETNVKSLCDFLRLADPARNEQTSLLQSQLLTLLSGAKDVYQ